MPERISIATTDLPARIGVEVLAGRRVSKVRADGVRLADGDFLPGGLVVRAAGVKGPEVLKEIGEMETTRTNQLLAAPTLRTTRDPDIFGMGDCAACPRPDGKGFLPPRAQAAHQRASHMVGQMDRRLAGQALTDFVYRDFGSLVLLGKYSTVGSLMGKSMFIAGHFARLMYRSTTRCTRPRCMAGRRCCGGRRRGW
ncbi:NAD(P)/FAD-dependent oxidoreductase [Dankookia sp. GCM10030260]|uniref:NAD(P)/FAD-dependent oxidoreductase n=1 Tax=Dankookia sp. GCM10030260 TaxID=3273390 RepID=UPI0036174C9F